MREIKFKDTFTLARILKKINVKKIISENKEMFQTGKKSEEQGLQLFLNAFTELGEAEQEVYKILADFSGCTPKEVEDRDIDQIKKFYEDFKGANSIQKIKSLFTQAIG